MAYASLDGRKVAYAEVGSSKPVVLVHGSFATKLCVHCRSASPRPGRWCAIGSPRKARASCKSKAPGAS
jgi:hypothetical protein